MTTAKTKQQKKMLNLQEADYNRGVAREDQMDKNFSDAYNNSDLKKKKKKAQPLVALG